MNDQNRFEHEVMAELEQLERNQLFPMDREIKEFATSHEKQAMPPPLRVANTKGN